MNACTRTGRTAILVFSAVLTSVVLLFGVIAQTAHADPYLSVDKDGWSYYADTPFSVNGTSISESPLNIVAVKNGDTEGKLAVFRYDSSKQNNSTQLFYTENQDHYAADNYGDSGHYMPASCQKSYLRIATTGNSITDATYTATLYKDKIVNGKCQKTYVSTDGITINSSMPADIQEISNLKNNGKEPVGCPGFSGLPAGAPQTDLNYNCPDGKHSVQKGVLTNSVIKRQTESTGVNGNDDPTGTQNEDDTTPDCYVSVGPLNWVVCPVTSLVNGAIRSLDSIIGSLLKIDTTNIYSTSTSGPASSTNTADGYYQAWSSFRTIALGIVILATLIIVIASAFGFDFLDAYTMKKALPRVFIAVIGIALSWQLTEFAINFSNDLGIAVRGIIYAPFSSLPSFTATLGSEAIFIAVIAAGFATYGLSFLLFGLTALLAVLIAIITLIIREMVVIFCVIIAPVAIACYILPGTEKFWKLWSKSFTAVLIAFPIISGFIAIGRVFAAIATSSGGIVMNVIAFIAYFLPYFMIPFAFKFAGGVMATISGIGNDKSRGMFDRLSKTRQQSSKRRWGEGGTVREPIARRTLQRRADITSGIQGWSSNSERNRITRFIGRRAAGAVGGRNIEASMSAKRAHAVKEIQDQVNTGDDSIVRALTAYGEAFLDDDGVLKYKTLGGATATEADVRRAQQLWGHDTFAQQAALSYEMGKATTEDQIQNVAEQYVGWANERGMSSKQRMDVWMGAAFANQNTHLEYKRMSESGGRMSLSHNDSGGRSGYDSFVDEIYEKRGAYNLAQMSSNTIVELQKAWNDADANTAKGQETRQKIAAISENFMNRYGSMGGNVVGMPENGQPVVIGGPPQGSLITPTTPTPTQGIQIPSSARNGVMLNPQTTQTASNISANTPGSAHTAERVLELAQLTGVYQDRPQAPHSSNPMPPIGHQR